MHAMAHFTAMQNSARTITDRSGVLAGKWLRLRKADGHIIAMVADYDPYRHQHQLATGGTVSLPGSVLEWIAFIISTSSNVVAWQSRMMLLNGARTLDCA